MLTPPPECSLSLIHIWYPSKGYSFNITNSTSYDQYYVHGLSLIHILRWRDIRPLGMIMEAAIFLL